jgi:hypothetical protein
MFVTKKRTVQLGKEEKNRKFDTFDYLSSILCAYIVSIKWQFDKMLFLQQIFEIVSFDNLQFYNLVFDIKK